jgi:hypothetical protein
MEFTLWRSGRTLQTIAVDIIEPAVISAGDASLLDPTVGKRDASMGATVFEKAHPSLLIAKQHEIFSQYPHELDGVFFGQLAGDGDRVPVTAEQFPCRGSRPHSG